MLVKPPGFEDIFPDSINRWNFVINSARDIFKNFNYREIILPILEYTEVFSRGLGDETDIVSKEMFTLEDRGGRSLTLRPEATASVVRAYVENGEYNRLSTCKFFYSGAMFRAERPQKGRLRQFNQFGAEIFGSAAPFHDYEIISMMDAVTKRLGINNYSILLNSIGCHACRMEYIKELKTFFSGQLDKLCEDCTRRLEKNPLRILDCKKHNCIELKKDSPIISSYLCEDCKEHYSTVKEYLNMNDISFTEDPFLVRGLDYYTKTTFEFVSMSLGGQNAFAAGGRYDTLVETFGGKPTPAVGFAAGIERILLLIEEKKISPQTIDVFIIYSGDKAFIKAVKLLNLLRSHNISADFDPNPKGFKPQFKKADRERAEYAIIIGEDEIAADSYTIKDMKSGEQSSVKAEDILNIIIPLIT